MRLSTVSGAIVSLLAYGFTTNFATVFTSDPAVLAAMASCAPLIFLALLLHSSTMCSEGLLLASRQLKFLARTYAVNVLLFLSSLFFIAKSKLGLQAVWKGLFAFQLVG